LLRPVLALRSSNTIRRITFPLSLPLCLFPSPSLSPSLSYYFTGRPPDTSFQNLALGPRRVSIVVLSLAANLQLISSPSLLPHHYLVSHPRLAIIGRAFLQPQSRLRDLVRFFLFGITSSSTSGSNDEGATPDGNGEEKDDPMLH
jgi:hypothetical protein